MSSTCNHFSAKLESLIHKSKFLEVLIKYLYILKSLKSDQQCFTKFTSTTYLYFGFRAIFLHCHWWMKKIYMVICLIYSKFSSLKSYYCVCKLQQLPSYLHEWHIFMGAVQFAPPHTIRDSFSESHIMLAPNTGTG